MLSRNTNTKEMLKNALITLLSKSSFEDISVRELTSIAHLNRSTFYLHYSDKYDMANSFKNEILDDFETICMANNHSPEKISRAILTYLKNDSDFFYTVLQIPCINFSQILKSLVLKYCINTKNVKILISQKYNLPENYAIEVQLASIERILSIWINNKCRDSVDIVTGYILKILI